MSSRGETAILSHLAGVVEPSTVEIVATEPERAALASAYDLVAVKALAATATVTPGAKGAVAVDGRVVADIVQTCVVGLVPVDEHIDEPFCVHFVREAPPLPKPGTEIVIDPDAPDPPEVLTGPTVDVGALAEETFALAIDPYPRAPGAAIPAELAMDPDDRPDSPFAVLAALARDPEK